MPLERNTLKEFRNSIPGLELSPQSNMEDYAKITYLVSQLKESNLKVTDEFEKLNKSIRNKFDELIKIASKFNGEEKYNKIMLIYNEINQIEDQIQILKNKI